MVCNFINCLWLIEDHLDPILDYLDNIAHLRYIEKTNYPYQNFKLQKLCRKWAKQFAKNWAKKSCKKLSKLWAKNWAKNRVKNCTKIIIFLLSEAHKLSLLNKCQITHLKRPFYQKCVNNLYIVRKYVSKE